MNLMPLLMTVVCLAVHPSASAQAVGVDLSTITQASAWTVTHAAAQLVDLDGRRAVRLIAAGDSANGIVGLAQATGASFSTGTIEVELKGKNVRQRSFLGVAFNINDERTFEAVYFRPFNFKAEAPLNGRSVQYIAWPTYTWEQLRTRHPGQFEQPVSPVPDPDGWFRASVEVSESAVRVFVDGAKEPSLVVTRLAKGGTPRPFGLFVDSSDGVYANLSVSPLMVAR